MPSQANTYSPAIRHLAGFSLIELMIVVLIAAILAAVAIPTYSSYVMKGRRADAINALHAVVDAQERYRSNASSYSDALATLKIDSSISQHYDLSIDAISTGYSLAVGYKVLAEAKANGAQYNDQDCRTMSITVRGGQLIYGAERLDNSKNVECWPK